MVAHFLEGCPLAFLRPAAGGCASLPSPKPGKGPRCPEGGVALSLAPSLFFSSSHPPRGKPYGRVFRVRAKGRSRTGPGDSPAALMCLVGGPSCELAA